MKISFADPALPSSGTLVAFATEERQLSPTARTLDERSGGLIARAMAGGRFAGKANEVLPVTLPAGLGPDQVLLVGLGKAEKADEAAAQAAGGTVVGALNRAGRTEAAVALDAVPGAKLSAARMAAEFAFGARLASYRFDKYRTKEKAEQKPSLQALAIGVPESGAAGKAYQDLEKVADGVFLTRDLVNEPGNVIYPETLAERCLELTQLGVEVEILDEKQMAKLGMGALLGVAQGSDRPPRLIVMRWNGGAKGDKPVAFVGKGVTFDTGGISLKPGPGMWDMKFDMAGAAAVIGAMAAIAGRKAKANVVAVVGAVENMPGSNAQRPGDIVTSMSGQTIEVLNTDAEGRLVLADAVWYTQETFKPRLMVDLATLTGAILIALGSEHAGLFANDDALADQLLAAGRSTGEKLWRMPLSDAYDKMIDADQADMKNIAGGTRDAGSIVGAQFIQRFTNGVPWAHLDVAGTVWSTKDTPTGPKGATGYGVRLLDRFIADNFEG